jgi:hypothetical protein
MRQHSKKVSWTAGRLASGWFWGPLLTAWAVAGEAIAAGGGKPVTKLVNVVDTRNMSPGFVRWVADVYNTNLWLYGLLVVGIMAGMGIFFGSVFDRLIAMLGINLGKLDHHE